jgi:putative heme-binding domain-containing protein
MGLRVALGRSPSRWAVAAVVLATLGATWAILFRPESDPDRLWRSIQADLKTGDLDRAEASMTRLLQLRPATDDQWLVLGQLAMTRGRDSRALEYLARVSDGHPMAARARIWEGSIELRNQRARRAEAAFLRALRLDPCDTTPRRKLIYLYCMQRRRRELSEQFAALSRLAVLGFDETMLWGSSLASSWDPSEVRPILEGFVKADPDDRSSRLVLAEALRRLRRNDDVEAVLSPLPSSDPEVRSIRARMAAEAGNEGEVERLTSDHPDAHPVLARMRASLALSRRDLPAACKHLRAALAADPHNRAVLFQLGDTLIRSGEVEEGRRYIAAAKEHDALYDLIEQAEPGGRENARLLRAIADASLRLGLRAEARAWYLLALQLDPASPETQKSLYRLEHDEAGPADESPASEGTHNPRGPAMPIEPARPRVLVLGAEPATAAHREELARYARQHPGDPARGRTLFFDPKGAGCARCHRARGAGGEIGPDLSDVGGKYERAQLVESVLEPSRQIVEGYRPEVVATTDGRIFCGLVRAESDRELTLVDAQGRRLVVAKAELEDRRPSAASLMPDGLAAGLSPASFADLIAYLQTLRSAGMGTPGSGLTGPVVLPPGFLSDRIAAGITGATALAVAPDGRIFVCEQTGTLRVIRDGRLVSEPFLTLDVDSTWERGLIGVTLDPRFAHNGYLYVCYVAPRPYVHHRISRFTAAGDVAVPGSELVLLEGDDQARLGGSVPAGHQGGAIHFGGDGKLYAALGDQTAGMPAQDLTTFQGKLLRLNPGGSIPEDNPFFRTARGKYRAIWALGLRNPFRFAVQPGTGRILINDVGQDTWEEIDEGVSGGNYGWPACEGPTADPRFRGPIYHYPVASITGGAFCPAGAATAFPLQYRGRYFFMDFVRGWIKVLDPDHPRGVETFATGLMRPVDLDFGADGTLYVLLRDAWVIDPNFRKSTGSLLRIRPQPADGGPPKPPLVRVSEVTVHGDLDCYKVETATATYVYGKRGAGFASLLDKDGRDWISYRPGDKARGEYRGLPKCGQPTKFFHCGYGYGQYRTENPFSSRVTLREAGHVRIESETRDGKSACRWDFYPGHATLTLLRIDLPTFWFLYEGTPGGALDAEGDFVIRPDGSKTTLDHAWSQVVPWVCFGASETPVGFVCVNHQDPEPGETDSYVSWPFRRDEADGSFRDMTVFGFGRKGYRELIQHVPDLKRLPARYSIGFVDRADYTTARAACERLRRRDDGANR